MKNLSKACIKQQLQTGLKLIKICLKILTVEMLQTDIYATNIYTLGYEKDSWANLDYTNKIITMEDMKGTVRV